MSGPVEIAGFVVSGTRRVIAEASGFCVGIDTDDRSPQLSHICWPVQSERGAICGSESIWGCWPIDPTGRDPEITCMGCVETWSRLLDVERLQDTDRQELLKVIGALVLRLARIEGVVLGR